MGVPFAMLGVSVRNMILLCLIFKIFVYVDVYFYFILGGSNSVQNVKTTCESAFFILLTIKRHEEKCQFEYQNSYSIIVQY